MFLRHDENVSNEFGLIHCIFNSRIFPEPKTERLRPVDLKVSQIKENTVRLDWTASDAENVRYSIKKYEQDEGWKTLEDEYKGTRYETSVTSILTAQFTVQPKTDDQVGEESKIAKVPQGGE